MSLLLSICQKCGGSLPTGSDQLEGGLNPCHLRDPIENHEFSMMVKKPPETEAEWYNRMYGELYDDSRGHHIVVCKAGCGYIVTGHKGFDFGGSFRAHLKCNHPYPY